jgi:hypothetical protein
MATTGGTRGSTRIRQEWCVHDEEEGRASARWAARTSSSGGAKGSSRHILLFLHVGYNLRFVHMCVASDGLSNRSIILF